MNKISEKTLFGTIDKVAVAIARLKQYAIPNGYYLAFSGGKDSVVIYRLAQLAGVKFTAHYSYPGLDPRELVNFIKREYPDVIFHYPKRTYGMVFMWKTMPPLRQKRWCCELLKEGQGEGIVVLGIRRAESTGRKNRPVLQDCKGRWLLCPIVDWTDKDVWDFIREQNIPYCKLYDEGYKRIGCIACPFASEKKRRQELERFPRFRKMYSALFRRAFERRQRLQKPLKQKSSEEWLEWWLTKSPREKDAEGQCFLFDN